MRSLRNRVLAFVSLALFATAAVAADPLVDATAAYNSGDFDKALRLLRPVAEQGDASAQYNIGFMYRKGEGVPQDYAEAVRWYRLAAEQGHVDAQLNLGVMYNDGKGVSRDLAEAMKWYRRAAEQGSGEAQSNLGVMYGNGEGVPQDVAEAVKWYRRASEQGVALAQCNLAIMYVRGAGVPQDLVQAHKWLDVATALFLPDQDKEKETAVTLRDKIASILTPEQLAEAQRLAREWKPTPEKPPGK